MKFSSIKAVEHELSKLHDLMIQRGADDMALDRMWPLLEVAGNPHEKLKVVHVAGTSGKTSTSYYIAQQLRSTGVHVGLTVSPHIDSITERIQLDGAPISEEMFCEEIGSFFEYVKAVDNTPSYFETMIGFAFWFFHKHKVDYVVAETGLGGLFDGTNVVTRKDKVCVVTDIGMDHMHILGSDIKDIATQKAGIIQQANQVFMIQQSDEVMHVFEDRAQKKQATLNVISYEQSKEYIHTKHVKLPQFQRRNWMLAETVCTYIAARDELQDIDKLDPLSINVPGRMEISTTSDGSTLILDGAHNEQKVATFVSSFQELYPGKKAVILLGMKKSKEYKEVLDVLKPIADRIIVTSFKEEQDFPIVSHDPQVMADEANKLGVDVSVTVPADKALEELLSHPHDIKLVIGSIYLLGTIRWLM